jgi:hypothetical protein
MRFEDMSSVKSAIVSNGDVKKMLDTSLGAFIIIIVFK